MQASTEYSENNAGEERMKGAERYRECDGLKNKTNDETSGLPWQQIRVTFATAA